MNLALIQMGQVASIARRLRELRQEGSEEDRADDASLSQQMEETVLEAILTPP